MAVDDKGADTGAQDTGAADKGAVIDAGADKGAAGAVDKTLAEGGAGAADKGAADGAGAAKPDAGAATADWRDRMAGEDKDFRKRLERFADETQLAKSYRSLEQKLSSGEFKKTLPENATAEETATWRKENGIPDKPEGYLEKLALPNGMVVGEEDKPIVSAFAEMALSKNWSTAQLNDAVAWHYAMQDKQRAEMQEQDGSFRTTTEDALRNQWKADYRTNMNLEAAVTQYRQAVRRSVRRPRFGSSRADDQGNRHQGQHRDFLVAGSGTDTAVTRGTNGQIPYGNPTNSQLTATLVEKHAPYELTGFNIFAARATRRRSCARRR
jgi:hypothetical protein